MSSATPEGDRGGNPPGRPGGGRTRRVRVRVGSDGTPITRWGRRRARFRKTLGRPLLLLAAFALGIVIVWLLLQRLIKEPPMPSE